MVEHAPLKPLRWVGSSRKDLERFPEELQDVEDFRGDTYRVAYTVRFSGLVYVLHAFKKKSKRGAETPKVEIDRVRDRQRAAQRHYREHGEGTGR